jgi:hypothetical protein
LRVARRPRRGRRSRSLAEKRNRVRRETAASARRGPARDRRRLRAGGAGRAIRARSARGSSLPTARAPTRRQRRAARTPRGSWLDLRRVGARRPRRSRPSRSRPAKVQLRETGDRGKPRVVVRAEIREDAARARRRGIRTRPARGSLIPSACAPTDCGDERLPSPRGAGSKCASGREGHGEAACAPGSGGDVIPATPASVTPSPRTFPRTALRWLERVPPRASAPGAGSRTQGWCPCGRLG